MLSSETKFAPHVEVVPTELKNGETVLLHLGTQNYYTLNETGSFIWRLLGQAYSLGEIGQALEAQYEVTHEQARQSVVNLATELVAVELVAVSGDPEADQAG